MREPKLERVNGCGRVWFAGKYHYLGGFDTPQCHEKYHATLAQWREANGIDEPEPLPSEHSVAELLAEFWEWADGSREEAVAKFARWLQTSPLRDDINELRGKVLGCFCHPQNCHGQVLAAMISMLPSLKVCQRCGARMNHATVCFCEWDEPRQLELFEPERPNTGIPVFVG